MNGRIAALITVALLMPSAAAPQQAEIATALAFTEGPTVDRDGNVYFTELVFQRIMKLTPQGVLSVFRENSNNANGMLIDPQGRLVACEGAASQRMGVAQTFKPQVTRTDLKTGRIEVLAESYQGKPFVGPNDVTIDSRAGCTSPIFLAAPSTGSTPRVSSSASSRRRRFSVPTASRFLQTIRRCT